ncbi:MAG: hypothetical protein HYX93_06890 [Chloroflexi bacterium]|nr:hypothetical protein [Chloroflexota bacterium]
MSQEELGLPARPFFSCTPEEFVVVDAEAAKSALRSGFMEPWMKFERGDGNVIDSVPHRVASQQEDVVAVECEGATVYIDFAEGRARKVTSQGEFVYRGTLEERNEGRGYIPLS